MIEFLKYQNFEYLLKLPDKVEGKLPVIIFLHGAGTRGTDLNTLSTNPFFNEGSLYSKKDCPAIYTLLCLL